MELDIGNDTKNIIIKSIQNAMNRSKMNRINKDTIVNMAASMDKWDCIITYIYENMQNEKHNVGILDLGIFKVVLIYEKKSKVLFSIMRDSNYKGFLQGQKKSTHYINAALNLNKSLDRKNEQLTLDCIKPLLSEEEEEVLDWKKNQIINSVNTLEEDISNYVTLVFKEKNYVLESINACLTNEYHEIIKDMDWGEFIIPDIEDAYMEQEDSEEYDIPIYIKDKELETTIPMDDIETELDVNIKKEENINSF